MTLEQLFCQHSNVVQGVINWHISANASAPVYFPLVVRRQKLGLEDGIRYIGKNMLWEISCHQK